jgi:hypothetical protein
LLKASRRGVNLLTNWKIQHLKGDVSPKQHNLPKEIPNPASPKSTARNKMKPRKYQMPDFVSPVRQDVYEKWLHGRAVAHVKRDKKRGNTTASNEAYKIAIHRAVGGKPSLRTGLPPAPRSSVVFGNSHFSMFSGLELSGLFEQLFQFPI